MVAVAVRGPGPSPAHPGPPPGPSCGPTSRAVVDGSWRAAHPRLQRGRYATPLRQVGSWALSAPHHPPSVSEVSPSGLDTNSNTTGEQLLPATVSSPDNRSHRTSSRWATPRSHLIDQRPPIEPLADCESVQQPPSLPATPNVSDLAPQPPPSGRHQSNLASRWRPSLWGGHVAAVPLGRGAASAFRPRSGPSHPAASGDDAEDHTRERRKGARRRGGVWRRRWTGGWQGVVRFGQRLCGEVGQVGHGVPPPGGRPRGGAGQGRRGGAAAPIAESHVVHGRAGRRAEGLSVKRALCRNNARYCACGGEGSARRPPRVIAGRWGLPTPNARVRRPHPRVR